MATQGLTTLERFERKFTRGAPDECWEWQAGRDKDGYGTFWFGTANKRAHRMALFLYRSVPLKNGLLACHHCDNPPCVNPDHLFVGTITDNNIDMTIKERGGKTKLTADQVREIRARLATGEKAWRIALDYGMTGAPIYRIQYGETWKHLL